MFDLLIIGVGGFCGAILRYLTSTFTQHLAGDTAFPFGTLTVNTVGCLIIGLLAGLAETRQIFSPEARMFVFIGILGGFTTFSTFGYESFYMIQENQYTLALTNIGLNVVCGLAAVWGGLMLSRAI